MGSFYNTMLYMGEWEGKKPYRPQLHHHSHDQFKRYKTTLYKKQKRDMIGENGSYRIMALSGFP